MVEASPNLAKKQQERLLDQLQKKHDIFLTYDLEKPEDLQSAGPIEIERFYNKDHNFSIGWYPDLKSLYNIKLHNQLKALESF